MKQILMIVAAFVATSVFAQSRESFLKQQAYAEMQRVSGQIDVLQNNIEELQRKVGNIERGNNDSSIRQEIEALKRAIGEIRQELSAQRGEIVKDLSSRIAKMQPKEAPAEKVAPKKVYKGACEEYVVQSGDSLYMIALAFKTTVQQIKDMNNLKKDAVRVGQKLLVPKVKD